MLTRRSFVECHNYVSLQWRHNDYDGVSNHQRHGCLLNRLFRRRSKKTSKLRVTGLCVGNSPGPVNSAHKWPVTRKMFPFDDVIMFSPLTDLVPPHAMKLIRMPAQIYSIPQLIIYMYTCCRLAWCSRKTTCSWIRILLLNWKCIRPAHTHDKYGSNERHFTAYLATRFEYTQLLSTS